MLVFQAAVCSVTDIKYGKINNTYVFIGVAAAISANIVYFMLIHGRLLVPFLINSAFAVITSVLLYALHIWAGGDVKLFVLMSLLLPAEYEKHTVPMPIIIVFIVSFSVAFLYLIIESVILCTKNKRKKAAMKITLSVRQIFACFVSVTAVQILLRLLLGNIYYNYVSLFLFLNVFIVLFIGKLHFLYRKIPIIICSFISFGGIIYSAVNGGISIDVKSIMISAVVILFRFFAERFNYMQIKTADVEKGMILSYATVMGFTGSRVKGLPESTAEDMSSRITEEQADSIKRWESSKSGKSEIVILRKMPFAIFISVGYLVYLIMSVFIW